MNGNNLNYYDVTLKVNGTTLDITSGGSITAQPGYNEFLLPHGSGSVEIDSSFTNAYLWASNSGDLRGPFFGAIIAGQTDISYNGLYFNQMGCKVFCELYASNTANGTWTTVTSAPEIDPASAASGLTLLLGGLAVFLARRRSSGRISVSTH